MPRLCPLLDERARAASEDQYEAVQRALAQNRAELKRQRDRARQERKKELTIWKLSHFVSNVVLILFGLSQCTCDCPVAFLQQHVRRKGWPAKEDEELAEVIQNTFLDIDVDVYVRLTDPFNSSDKQAMKAAVRFRSMFAAHAWVKGLNQGKGIAPPSALVGTKLEELQARYPAQFSHRNLNVPWQSNYRVVVHRWRRLFGNRYGRIRRRDNMSAEEMQRKATQSIANAK